MSLQMRTEVSMTPDQILIDAAISSWQQVVTRVGALCLSLNEEQLLVEVAPGKNRILYLWGHLTAVHDAMFSVLRTGERLHPELDPSSSPNLTDRSRFQSPRRSPNVGRRFIRHSFRHSRLSVLTSG
jgi:hypothetical protein